MTQPFKSNPYQTLLVICSGILGLYWLIGSEWCIWLAFALGVVGIVSQKTAAFIEWFWMKLAILLGLFVPKIVLSLVFFLLLTPMALLAKLIQKKDTLLLKKTENSNFASVQKNYTKKSFEKPW